MLDPKSQLRLRTGRVLYLREFRQWEFYEGLLEGLPTSAMNQRRLAAIAAKYRGKSYGADPLLIQPTEKPITWDREEPYPFGKPAALPAIVCAARFDCLEPARDLSKEFSGLLVVWFQDAFAFPIDPSAQEQLSAMDWERYAVDMDY